MSKLIWDLIKQIQKDREKNPRHYYHNELGLGETTHRVCAAQNRYRRFKSTNDEYREVDNLERARDAKAINRGY